MLLTMTRMFVAMLILGALLAPSSHGQEPGREQKVLANKRRLADGKIFRVSNVTRSGHVVIMNESGEVVDLDLRTLTAQAVHDYESEEAVGNAQLSIAEDGKTIAVYRCCAGVIEILERDDRGWRIRYTEKMGSFKFGAVFLPATKGTAFVVDYFENDDNDVYPVLLRWKYDAPQLDLQSRAKFSGDYVWGLLGDASGDHLIVSAAEKTWVVDTKNKKIAAYPFGGVVALSPDEKRIVIVASGQLIAAPPERLQVIVGDLAGKIQGSFLKEGLEQLGDRAVVFSSDSRSLLTIDAEQRVASFAFDGAPLGSVGAPIPGARRVIPTSATRGVVLADADGIWAVETLLPKAAGK